ncbi:hypothetical protein ABU162_22730 [Paenibacillus thiaminolyticus]|uniref:hypothetical protein n=1 Tax=Paenibacillus thiaminolyticus TaxID=49283 RepID=UPI0035A60D7B
MHSRQVKLLASGKYLPKRKLTSADMDRLLGVPDGWVQKKSDILVNVIKIRRGNHNQTQEQVIEKISARKLCHLLLSSLLVSYVISLALIPAH